MHKCFYCGRNFQYSHRRRCLVRHRKLNEAKKKIIAFAKAMNIPLVSESAPCPEEGKLAWRGYGLNITGGIGHTIHEICHWLVAPAERRSFVDFGHSKITIHERESEERDVMVLEKMIQTDLVIDEI